MCLNPQRIITRLCSPPQLYRALWCLSTSVFWLLGHKLSVSSHPQCSHQCCLQMCPGIGGDQKRANRIVNIRHTLVMARCFSLLLVCPSYLPFLLFVLHVSDSSWARPQSPAANQLISLSIRTPVFHTIIARLFSPLLW